MHSFANDLDVIIHLIGLIVFALIFIVGTFFSIIFACDMVSLSRLRRYLRKYYARQLNLHQEYEAEKLSDEELQIQVDVFQDAANDAKSARERIVWLESCDVFRSEIGRRIALKEKQAAHFKSLLPFLFIPYVDGLAQVIGYCILIPLFLSSVIVGVLYTVHSIRHARYRRELQAQNARMVQLHKELNLEALSTSDLVSILLRFQETTRDMKESDPSYADLKARIEVTQNELADRQWKWEKR